MYFLCGIGDTQTVMQIEFRLQPKMKLTAYDLQQY